MQEKTDTDVLTKGDIADAKPFTGDDPEDVNLGGSVARLADETKPLDVASLKAEGAVVDAEDLFEGPPHLDKSLLVGVPFIFRDVRVLEGGAVNPETGVIDDLIICAGQAVKLTRGGISEAGYVFTFTAGAAHSVLGGQMVEDGYSARRDNRAILYRQGLIERRAKLGTYYTTRAAQTDKALDLFKR
jgi:hypothetical protein